jgi:hypothetical protein
MIGRILPAAQSPGCERGGCSLSQHATVVKLVRWIVQVGFEDFWQNSELFPTFGKG